MLVSSTRGAHEGHARHVDSCSGVELLYVTITVMIADVTSIAAIVVTWVRPAVVLRHVLMHMPMCQGHRGGREAPEQGDDDCDEAEREGMTHARMYGWIVGLPTAAAHRGEIDN
jgi:hypothetical protein